MIHRLEKIAYEAIDALLAGQWSIAVLSPRIDYGNQATLFPFPLRTFFTVDGSNSRPTWPERPEVMLEWDWQEPIGAPYLTGVSSCWAMACHAFVTLDDERIAAISGLMTLPHWVHKDDFDSLFDECADGDPWVVALSSSLALTDESLQRAFEEAFELMSGIDCGDSSEFARLLDIEYDCPP